METITELFNQPESSYVGLQKPYYIYSEVKQWVLDKFQSEGANQ